MIVLLSQEEEIKSTSSVLVLVCPYCSTNSSNYFKVMIPT